MVGRVVVMDGERGNGKEEEFEDMIPLLWDSG